MLYRAAVLVGGMAAGAFILVDLPALLLSGSSHSSNNSFGWVIFVLVIGGGIMYSAFRTFRYGEQYEYHSGPKRLTAPIGGNIGQQIGQVVRVLEQFK